MTVLNSKEQYLWLTLQGDMWVIHHHLKGNILQQRTAIVIMQHLLLQSDTSDHSTCDLTSNYLPSEIQGECTLKQIRSIRLSPPKYCLFLLGSLLSAGTLLLFAHWYPFLKRFCYYDQVPFSQATHLSIVNYDGQLTICALHEQQIWDDQKTSTKMYSFTNRYLKYTINRNETITPQLFNIRNRLQTIVTTPDRGLSTTQVANLRQCYGKGTMQISRVQWYELLIKEIFRPLYIFLFFSTSLWLYEQYYIYTAVIMATCWVAIVITVWQLLALNKKIYEMAYYEAQINTLRNGGVVRVSSLELVPGDVVFLKEQIKLPFEGVILQGSALVNQCALTGESVPVVKKADLIGKYRNTDRELDKSVYVYQGTSIVQVNSKKQMLMYEPYRSYGIPVCVSRTNFSTLKGQLIRIILFPKQQENIFQKQSGKFLLFLFMVSLLTFLGMIPQLLKTGSPADIIVSFLDLVAITVPAALPVSMAFGVIYSIGKLKQKNIFCIEENKVIVGGDVSFCCFDKTGTLTQDFMDFQALIPCIQAKFIPTIKNRLNQRASIRKSLQTEPHLNDIFSNMAANHSIVKVESTGELVGDPMEVKLLLFGDFSINQANIDPNVIFGFQSDRGHSGLVYRRFEFDSDLQRMSVVCLVTDASGHQSWHSFAKGSPETMSTIMLPSSLPPNYYQVLRDYTSNGFRVLAIASKLLEEENYATVTREEAESGLYFNGFQVFENKLKGQSKKAIAELKQAEIGVVMITGDNALTGANIAYKCNIAHEAQGMVICDYRGGEFVEEPFYYHQRDPEESIVEGLPKEDDYHKTFLGKGKKPVGVEIEMTQNFKRNKPSNLSNIHDQIDNEQTYIEKLLQRAKQDKCQLCLTGNAFNQLFRGKIQQISQLKQALLTKTTVYARTKPNDKAKIVMAYQHTKKTVAMCGDGANDCGALKQADIGLSLSPAEASISAPFTSQVTNISSMVELIKQCRAGLATNFSLFNIMASYALTQYVVTTISQIFYAYPAQYQYMYWDLACNFLFIVLVGRTGTAETLSAARPSNSLFCVSNLFQVMFSFVMVVVGDICVVSSLSGRFAEDIDYPNIGGFQTNLNRYLQDGDRPSDGPETSALFLFANLMYLFTLLAFNLGRPWRKPVYTNTLFMVFMAVVLGYSSVIVMVPGARWGEFQVRYMEGGRLTGFILGLGWGIGLAILGMQKCLWEPLFLWVKGKYSTKTWL